MTNGHMPFADWLDKCRAELRRLHLTNCEETLVVKWPGGRFARVHAPNYVALGLDDPEGRN